MAITQLYVDVPLTYNSVNDQVWIYGTSNLSNQVNFKYVVDIFNDNNELLVRARVFPDVANNYFYFDASSVLKNEIRLDWFLDILSGNMGGFHLRELDQNGGEAGIRFTAYLGEEYYSGVDLIAAYQQTSYQDRVWTYVPPVFGRRITDILSLGKPATKRPLRIKYVRGSTDPILFGLLSYALDVNVKVFVYKFGNPTPIQDNFTISLFENTLQQFDISVRAVNNAVSYTLIDPPDVDFYVLELDNGGEVTTIRVDLICVPPDIEPISVHFLNSFGVFDTALFDLVNKKMLSVTRKGYEKSDWRFGDDKGIPTINYHSGTITNQYRGQYERKINFDTEAAYNMKLSMDFPTDEDWEWLGDLITSPQIYINRGTYPTVFYPVTIKADNYEFFRRRYAKLKTFEIEIELNQNRNYLRR